MRSQAPCITQLLAQMPPSYKLIFSLGRLVHGNFVPGVSEAQFARIQQRLRTNEAWTSAQSSKAAVNQPAPALLKPSPQQHLLQLHGSPLDIEAALCPPAQPPGLYAGRFVRQVCTTQLHTFEHKAWLFRLSHTECPQGCNLFDRDDDQDSKWLVQVEYVGQLGQQPAAYVADAGLLLCQDVLNMVAAHK